MRIKVQSTPHLSKVFIFVLQSAFYRKIFEPGWSNRGPAWSRYPLFSGGAWPPTFTIRILPK